MARVRYMKIILWSGTKTLELAQYVNQFWVRHKNIWTSLKCFGTRKRTRHYFFEKSIVKCIYFLCRYWCSTKVDDQLEHVGGQGNWGFCQQSCPPIALVASTPKPTTTTATEISEAAIRGDFLELHFAFKLVHFQHAHQIFYRILKLQLYCQFREDICFSGLSSRKYYYIITDRVVYL